MAACRVLNCDKYRITQYYSSSHKGLDIVKYYSQMCPITAHTEGVVTFCQTGQKNNPKATGNASYGNCVKIKHPNGYYTLYAHMEKVYVKKGQSVKKGQEIGYMGNTGRSFGGHLHFEVRTPKEDRINPQPYLNADLPGMGVKYYQVYDNVANRWLPKVQINANDYAGNLKHGVSGFRIEDVTEYRVHDKVKKKWLPAVKSFSDYAGNLPNDIDAVAIKTDKYKYQVHLKNSNRWLGWITGYNIKDSSKGYAGNIGETIDAIKVMNK